MLTKMAHISLSGRAAQLLMLGGPKNLAQVCSTRSVMTEVLLGWDTRLVFTQSSSILPDSNGSTEGSSPRDGRSMDQRLQMHRLRNNFSGPGPGLRLAKNRNDLVAEFYDLSKSVIDGRISVESLINSKTFLALDEQLNYHIDIMSNNQVVNILASLIKMSVNPSINMVKLLEHEVKFRINSIAMSQIMKLVKFYNAIDTSYEQKQLTDILNNRIRSALNNPRTTVRELVDIYHHLVSQSSQVSLLGLNEEKLLNLLTLQTQEDDDIVSQYIPKFIPYDYVSLCDVFVELAAARRRPTPLLKATATLLAKVPLPTEEESKPDIALLISTLNSLVSLNYINRLVVSKLVGDLATIVDLNKMDLTSKCNLLRSVASLKWRSEPLMKLFFDHVTTNQQGLDHRLILTLLHVTAKLNYKPDLDIHSFYQKFIKGPCEDSIDHKSRRWLDHVWSLAMLGVANDLHFESILSDEYMAVIENPSNVHRIQHADAMKVLNLRAIAVLETSFKPSHVERLDELANIPILRGSDMQKFASKITEALTGMVKSKDDLIRDIKTPFGFVIDCVVGMDENSELVGLDRDTTEANLTTLPRDSTTKMNDTTEPRKLALVYVLFDEVIANHPLEPVGHRRMISRVLGNLGYLTVFLPEGTLNREKTSADMAKQIKDLLIRTAESQKKSDRTAE